MKRMHIHVHVADLDASIRFYSALFGADPARRQTDYAKWSLTEPSVNFAISTTSTTTGVGHLGIEVESDAELEQIGSQGRAAELASTEEPDALCCYAHSNKRWFTDPQGIAWETFHTLGSLEVFGAGVQGAAPDEKRCCA
jgi:catechol 2,3-dioxygenase-like lactoylglutathione lyase family enzyme